jgi:hypothetical protein
MAEAVDHAEIGEDAAADDDIFEQRGRNVRKRARCLRVCAGQASIKAARVEAIRPIIFCPP